jgi:hypothetical protein
MIKYFKVIPLLILPILLPASYLFAESSKKEPSMNQKPSWFSRKNCSGLQIKRFKSVADATVLSSVEFADKPVIDSIRARIEKIPPEGDMFKKFGEDTELIHLIFTCENGEETVEIYRNHFKTPATSVHGQPGESEKFLYQDIEALLFPDYGKKMLKITGLKQHFKDFDISYQGSEHKDYAPITVQVKTDTFLIEDSKKGSEKLNINSGQLPPQPKDFFVNSKKFTLNTFHSSKKERLYPAYFEIAP